ncbi:hypothetical protein PGT21_004143 [Puccinia graminis f. sp. tritici]|uniref:Uncharacterized protein n=1 Tax=Puccinia graminis f. sp. tritici TaxID=56615 RepID=A0A5B0MI86_PUCGR|nr:hypothetical protein PGT21_004143 [Puccinia graminis f. sp. tritici]
MKKKLHFQPHQVGSYFCCQFCTVVVKATDDDDDDDDDAWLDYPEKRLAWLGVPLPVRRRSHLMSPPCIATPFDLTITKKDMVYPAHSPTTSSNEFLTMLPANLMQSYEPVELTERQKKLVEYLQASKGKRSLIAPAYFGLSCFGKLIFGFGASLTVKGVVAGNDTTTAIGSALCGAGFVCIIIVAFGFGAACSKIDKTRGILFKCCSVSSAIFIAAGYALNQYYVSERRSLLDIRLSFIPLFFGGALLVVSTSNFTAYTELCQLHEGPWRPFACLRRDLGRSLVDGSQARRANGLWSSMPSSSHLPWPVCTAERRSSGQITYAWRPNGPRAA